MMYKDMNQHQKQAWRVIRWTASEIVGGRENVLLDYPEDSEEYKEALELLHDRDYLVAEIYCDVMTNSSESQNKHLRFAGKEWIKEQINNLLTEWGYDD